ncbi:hypothetical protein V8E53_012471 [Lactarius tabidus]
MSVLSTSTTATPASSTTSSSASPSATPAFVFVAPGEMFTCGLSPIRWQYTGPSASLSINITNINIPQQAPLISSATTSSTSTSSGTTSTSSPVLRRDFRRQYYGYGGSYLPSINEPVGTGLDPTALNYTWPGVNVPQGWYELLATVQGVIQTTSSPTFFVQNGTNVGCVLQFTVSSSTSRIPVSTSSSPSQSAVIAASSSHSHAGAIAGGVIGGIAFFAAALVAFLFWFLRRRSRGTGNNNGRRWSAMALKRSRHTSGGGASTRKDPHHSGLPVLEADETYIGSDEELSTVGHEKAIANSPMVMPYNPSHPQAMRTSTQTSGSHSRVMSNPDPPLRPPSYQPHGGEVHPLERAHTIGNGPRRKPAPRYEEAGEVEAVRNGACSSTTTLESALGNNSRNSHGNGIGNSDPHVLQHQSSFGAMRPMHVMMPDPPPPART